MRARPALVLAALAAAATLRAGVEPWTPAGISSPQFESHAAFDPQMGDFYFVRSSPSFEGWRILVTRCGGNGWSAPAPPAFAGDGFEADPYFTPDGRTLYFISSRTTDGVKRSDLDIWRVDRNAAGVWGVPVRLPAPVNSTGPEWFPRPAPDGWLYFGSKREGGLGGNDIWRARSENGGRWVVENLGPAINTKGDEYEPLPSPDGTRMIIMAGDGLYESRRTPTGWTPRVKLPPEVNVNGTEIGAVFSPERTDAALARATRAGPPRASSSSSARALPEAWPPSCRGIQPSKKSTARDPRGGLATISQ